MGENALMSQKPKVYIAAPWANKLAALNVQRSFEKAGFEVVSRWITKHADKPADQTGLEYPLEFLRKEAQDDVDDVFAADFFCLLNTQKRGEETSGKAVETGLAIANGTHIVMVGGPTNIFHQMEIVKQVPYIEDAIEYCQKVWSEQDVVV